MASATSWKGRNSPRERNNAPGRCLNSQPGTAALRNAVVLAASSPGVPARNFRTADHPIPLLLALPPETSDGLRALISRLRLGMFGSVLIHAAHERG